MNPNKTPLLIALQTWPGDINAALNLTRLIADIESHTKESRRTDVEFALISRRDCNSDVCAEILKEAGRAFIKTHWIKGRRFGVGWPNGCNDLWQDGMTSVSVLTANDRLDVSGVLTFEADCIPLRPDWLDCLIREWKNREPGIECVGHLHDNDHINGNAMFDPRITRNHPELASSDGTAGWDSYHKKALMKIGQDTNFIFQIYNVKGLTVNAVRDIRKGNIVPALFHGIKGDSGVDIVREMIASGEFFGSQEESTDATEEAQESATDLVEKQEEPAEPIKAEVKPPKRRKVN